MTKDFEITLKVRNNRLLAKMREVGIETPADLARKTGIAYATIGTVMNMTRPGRAAINGGWRPVIIALSEFFGCTPEEIVPEPVRENPMERRTVRFGVNAADVQNLTASLRSVALPADRHFDQEETKTMVGRALTGLPPRVERVIRMRFGIGCEEQTLEEIANKFGVQRERIRQIEMKGLRMLRHPARSKDLRWLLDEVET
jgi:RNA polymerase sigma factor (sigma-70 family)